MTVTPHDDDSPEGAFCPHCFQWMASTTRLHKMRRELELTRAHRDDLERGLKAIIAVLAFGQPSPRTASVTYVAGYARAMDDMKNAITAAVELHQDAATYRPSDLTELPTVTTELTNGANHEQASE